MIFNRKFIKYWIPVVLWMSFIFWMSTERFSSENTASVIEPLLRLLAPQISLQGMDWAHSLLRKAGHVVEYFILSLLLFRAFRGDSSQSWNWRWSFWALLIVFLWALLDEFHQSFVPARTASITDVGIDTAGWGIAQFLTTVWRRRRRIGVRSIFLALILVAISYLWM